MKKYNEEKAKQIAELVRNGHTIKQAAEAVGHAESTIYEWRRAFPEFLQMLKDAGIERSRRIYEEARQREGEIVGSLVDLAIGKAKKVRTVTKYAADPHGNPIIVERQETEESVPANVGAAVFLLTNISPDNWKNRQDVKQENSGEIKTGLNITVESEKMAELIKKVKEK